MVAKNFKFLWRVHRDKQTVLAKMFNVSQSDISAYVNGKKPIPTDVLNKIAIRYDVSADDLINKDLSVEYDYPYTMTLGDAENFSKNMFLILTSKNAKSNENFLQAQKILLESLRISRIDELCEKLPALETAIELYQCAWKESGIYVALSNCITVILLIYAFYNQKGISIGEKLLSEGRLNAIDIKSSFLRDPSKKMDTNPFEDERKAFFEKYDDLVYENIQLLKGDSKYSELGDFYLALCYFIGFAEDFFEYEDISNAGMHMMIQLCKIENEHAIKFMESIPGIS